MLKYRWTETIKMRSLINELEALRIVFEKFPSLPHIEERLRRESLLKSAVHSARIEGNPLDPNSIHLGPTQEVEKEIHNREVADLIKAYNFVRSSVRPQKLTLPLIRKLHELAMKDISDDAGHFRTEPWGIFDQAGTTIYLAPAHFNVPSLTKELINLANKSKVHKVINAGVTQFLFEKIHPFADGNGRVGRLISASIMENGGFGLRGLVSFEEFVDRHRAQYYQVLEPSQDATDFIEFFLSALVSQANTTLEQFRNIPRVEASKDKLMPRRQEILATIRDHPDCSFDFIVRRFISINPKTLHFDLSCLMKAGFVQKLGTTRGALYRAK